MKPVYIPMRADLGAAPEKLADLQQALETVAGGWIDGQLVVLPPGAKPAGVPEAAPAAAPLHERIAQAHADLLYIDGTVVSVAEIRKLRYGL